MNWYDLLTDDEWTYQALTLSSKPRISPIAGAVMCYYYGWLCPVKYPGGADCAK